MEAVSKLATKLATVDIYRMLDEMFATAKYQKDVPDMVRDRLMLSGTYSTGKQIRTYGALGADEGGNYTVFTQSEKKRKGQISSYVTLSDTNEFHRSFKLVPKSTFAFIAYDEDKPDGKVSDNVDLDNIFNLSEGEMSALRAEVLPDLIKMIKLKINA